METKPAVYTTEFWVTVILQIIFTLNTLSIWDYVHPRWVSLIAQAILGSFYAVSRGIAKNKGSFDPHNGANYKIIPRKADVTNTHPRVH